ncbi:MAG TPA: glycosyltransferase [Thermoanaerobaculia bacterium]|nr:glycosyltransferase [Thermoanaerobaculia bacterium]
MRIAQIILPDASQYERKSARADLAALEGRYEFVDDPRKSDLAHVYGGGELPSSLRISVPYVSSTSMTRSRWPWRRAAGPARVVTWRELPEVVEDVFFTREPREERTGPKMIGSFHRRGTQNMVEQTLSRIHRFRDDVAWSVIDHVPTPADLRKVDVWADPAVEEEDLDGFTAEALVSGVPVVATRTEINIARSERGRTAFLVPGNDPNEMTHAILAALFKSEAAQAKIQAAGQTASKFRSRQRLRVLTHLYETLTQ